MQFWIVTGGAGSGKSKFCEMLERLGTGVQGFSSDEVVGQKLAESDVASQIGGLLGAEMLQEDGRIDRGRLREKVFQDSDARGALEHLLHPLVYEAMTVRREEARGRGANLFLAEVPLFFESSREVKPDLAVLVAAQVRVQTQRITTQRGLTEQAAARIIQAQLPLERKMILADVVVWNEGDSRLLEMQAQYLLQQLPINHVH